MDCVKKGFPIDFPCVFPAIFPYQSIVKSTGELAEPRPGSQVPSSPRVVIVFWAGLETARAAPAKIGWVDIRYLLVEI